MSAIKYFLHGAVGLVFGQTVGFFIPTSFLGGSRLVLIFALAVWWGVFGAYIGLLWNKMLKIGAVGIVGGFSGGLVWYGLIYPPFSIWGAISVIRKIAAQKITAIVMLK